MLSESTANYVKQMETQLPFTVTDTMAQRLGRIALVSQRQTVSLQDEQYAEASMWPEAPFHKSTQKAF